MKFVATKTADQLDLQALHRVRERLVSQRTGIINQIRAFLLEASWPVAGPSRRGTWNRPRTNPLDSYSTERLAARSTDRPWRSPNQFRCSDHEEAYEKSDIDEEHPDDRRWRIPRQGHDE